MEYSELGKIPISDEKPEGIDVRYEEEFELLQSEIDKLASPTEIDSFSWEAVVNSSSVILKEKSKDILVASYLCVGLVHTDGAKGLGLASNIYCDLLTEYWEGLYPLKKRMRGRHSAISWWVEKTETALENGLKLNSEADEYNAIIDKFQKIETFLSEKRELDVSVGQIIKKIKAIIPKEENKEKKEINHPVVKADNINELIDSIEFTNAADVIRGLSPLFQKIRQAAKFLREDKKENPQSYRWMRFAMWEPVKSIPASKDGITKLPPPSKQLLTRLEGLRYEEEWETLLLSSESALNNPQNIFLLDLNWYTAEALQNLGRRYQSAYGIVSHETSLFITRLSGVEELHFSDSTPFANEETRHWLNTISTGGSDDISLLFEEGENSVSEAMIEAKKLINEKGNVFDAVDYLQHRINNCYSKKEALLLRLGLVQILLTDKNEKVLIPHLDKIMEDIVNFRLDSWEPEIALNGLKRVYSVFKKHSDKKYRQRAEDAFNIIANISTVDAMKL